MTQESLPPSISSNVTDKFYILFSHNNINNNDMEMPCTIELWRDDSGMQYFIYQMEAFSQNVKRLLLLRSEDIRLDVKWRNDFKRGNEETFPCHDSLTTTIWKCLVLLSCGEMILVCNISYTKCSSCTQRLFCHCSMLMKYKICNFPFKRTII